MQQDNLRPQINIEVNDERTDEIYERDEISKNYDVTLTDVYEDFEEIYKINKKITG